MKSMVQAASEVIGRWGWAEAAFVFGALAAGMIVLALLWWREARLGGGAR